MSVGISFMCLVLLAGFFDSHLVAGEPNHGRIERSSYTDLQDFRNRVLQRLNQYRYENYLPMLERDEDLEEGAQSWATKESRELSMSHSCKRCRDYSEILARRRSTRPLPTGTEAGDWVYKSWFGDGYYSALTKDRNVLKFGLGLAYTRDPRDNTYHAYAVARFSRG